VGQAGVLALGPEVTPSLFRRWLARARAFAAEWAELRAVHQNQLAGTVVRTPLQAGGLFAQSWPFGFRWGFGMWAMHGCVALLGATSDQTPVLPVCFLAAATAACTPDLWQWQVAALSRVIIGACCRKPSSGWRRPRRPAARTAWGRSGTWTAARLFWRRRPARHSALFVCATSGAPHANPLRTAGLRTFVISLRIAQLSSEVLPHSMGCLVKSDMELMSCAGCVTR
jgi:hypothetical protein